MRQRPGHVRVLRQISISLTDTPHADASDEVHARAIVALAQGKPVEVQLLYPDMGIGEPLAAVAERYALDPGAAAKMAASAIRLSALKRHPALEQLSRDHHYALVVAQRLMRADEPTAAEARERFVAYWDPDGRGHFREEEEILLPACSGFMDPEHPIIAKVLTDHVRIRHLAGEVTGMQPPSLSVLHELGGHLERHVRREERELFPLIERSLPDAELRRLVALLTR